MVNIRRHHQSRRGSRRSRGPGIDICGSNAEIVETSGQHIWRADTVTERRVMNADLNREAGEIRAVRRATHTCGNARPIRHAAVGALEETEIRATDTVDTNWQAVCVAHQGAGAGVRGGQTVVDGIAANV